jgi:cell division septum initiation protein DivIVA
MDSYEKVVEERKKLREEIEQLKQVVAEYGADAATNRCLREAFENAVKSSPFPDLRWETMCNELYK